MQDREIARRVLARRQPVGKVCSGWLLRHMPVGSRRTHAAPPTGVIPTNSVGPTVMVGLTDDKHRSHIGNHDGYN
jgi:hypothetical protein